MSIGPSVAARALRAALLGLLLTQSHCRGRVDREGEAKRARALCASACAGIAAGCRNAARPESVRRQAQCVEQCALVREQATRAGCLRQQEQALVCLSKSPVACEPVSATASTLERGHGAEGCQAEFGRLLGCNAPCREPGVLRSSNGRVTFRGKTSEVQAEHLTLGCGPDERDLGRRSGPDAPCEHSSVCSHSRCRCPGSNAAYAARACVDGRCAAAEVACALVPSAVGYDACPAR